MATTGFQLIISWRNAESGDPIAFKQDGQRFKTSTRTLKFFSNALYKIHLKTQPATEFHHLHLGGSDLELVVMNGPNSGEYTAEWNTTGIDPTKKGDRQDITMILTGPGGNLRKVVQSKFYNKESSHAEWGHKMDSLIWTCAVDSQGNITVTDEKVQ
uniref:CB1 cannabinoid receptor-interacting protein 1 n=1 Tax=Acrobeloides nanus TaxID=290746 RepID=A0A914BWJ5_9BILA